VAKRSAGILLYRRRGQRLEVLLAHPGGPLWARKDDGAWSIPKGEYEDPEPARDAAVREFAEETGCRLAVDRLRELATVQQRGGKVVVAYACSGDLDPADAVSGTFELEWPPRSGRRQEFPEVDRVQWFEMPVAGTKILAGQRPLLEALVALVALIG
jgi:predicted NUDIX family NTP pyrophosphohydrolase